MDHQEATVPSPEDNLLEHLQQFLSVIETDVVPRLLFTRAVQSKSFWGSSGDLQASPCESIVPRWLLSSIQDVGVFSRAIQSLYHTGAVDLDPPEQLRDQYSIPSEWKQKHRERILLLDLERLLFDVLATMVQAFPNAYTEILWKETEAELWDIVISTCVPFLAVIEISDIVRYRSLESKDYDSDSPTFWMALAFFIVRVATLLKDHSPPSLQSLLKDIYRLLVDDSGKSTLSNLASLQLSIDILSLTVWDKGEQGNQLEKLQSLRSTIQNPESNAILDLALARCHREVPQTRDLSSLWESPNAGNWTACELLANAELRGTRLVMDIIKTSWDVLPLFVRVLIAHQAIQDHAFDVARETLEGCIEEITLSFGERSIERLVSGTQLMICSNSMAYEAKTLVLAEGLAPCICAHLTEGRMARAGNSETDVCSVAQSMRGINFAITVADSFLGLGEYDLAKSILTFIWKYTKPTETAMAMCLLRLLKANRRQRNENSDYDCLAYLQSLVPLLKHVSGEMIFQCFEEVVCNLEAIDSLSPNNWATWNNTLAQLLLMDVSKIQISKPMMSSIESYRKEIVRKKENMEKNLRTLAHLPSLGLEPDSSSTIEIDLPYNLLKGGESHYLVRLKSLILESLESCTRSPARKNSLHAEADSTNSPSNVDIASNHFDIQERRLVVAIDYGTTYTGVAIATPTGSSAYLDEIDVVQDWGPGMWNQQKIPSIISYSTGTERLERQWGADLSLQALAMVHTKLQLDVTDTASELELISERLEGIHDLDYQYIPGSAGDTYTRKGPEDIVQDYLARVVDYLLQTIPSFTGELRLRVPIDIVATIPAGWSYRAKNSYYQALRYAGLNKDNFPRMSNILLVSEAEAAAAYTARYLKESCGTDILKLRECFLVCDAGGGTVDVVAYRVKSLEPMFEMERITLPTAARCGSIFIDMAFKRWLSRLLGPELYSQLDGGHLLERIGSHGREGARIRYLMRHFEEYKQKFRHGHRAIHLDLPEPFENLHIDGRVDSGQITISFEDMKSFFNPCVDLVFELIAGQLMQIETMGLRVRNLLLVGGFAESKYLQEELTQSLTLRRIALRLPDTSWTAVVRGAAIMGIEKSRFSNSMAHTEMCSTGYAIAVNVPFSEVSHNPSDSNIDPITNTTIATSQLEWFVKKDDLILPESPRRVELGPFALQFVGETSGRGTIPIYGYNGEEDPPATLSRSMSDLTHIHTINYDLSNIPPDEFTKFTSRGQKSPMHMIPVMLELEVAAASLHISLRMKNRNLYVAKIQGIQGDRAKTPVSQMSPLFSPLSKPSVQLLLYLATLQRPQVTQDQASASSATINSSRGTKSKLGFKGLKSLRSKDRDTVVTPPISETVVIWSPSATAKTYELFKSLSSPDDASLTLLPGKRRSPLDVRELNDLIRTKYSLDLDIWSLRHCRPRDRDMVKDKMRRSDAALAKIMATVNLWDHLEDWESEQNWRQLRAIKERLIRSKICLWSEAPPWE
ncbi:hypothetical protein ONS95_000339 [Cadophora gregata]|uniref:uncharacterized protein n=1 Tax=Cadophora gregata TaxID=51156 RepID=UPI0026DAB2FE|nr:uncharacterized protein ONS95_000339 [Cadophora gregata]KAK0125658.1 hypothetical protein ONS96_009491 [Cadophora gregata f. sp. sojae]KAK0128368.1 hypothetical protein ONS95_000339 [Cadophora gregata]